ncbi:cell division protein FtsQ [Corynebacterium xerosis]|uniref:Cell division protein FtsQ n=1 Tax=Corynebacterium xerosis TaxID=1725 RepID=A0A2N6SWH4_9CORY|nr:FtsQ-type POTRA domain-containing protein [Corynebacterium xerosis]AYJ32153.1 FtsQ-type POTRA domain-containing protein [Corynebacterium xerosis]NMF09268.1 FtsQ-type POTRA domain-containing protein [Corynebacterium xerosis]PMC61427.1 cell division protein FtsQ [Corynebacterium xerosis]
MRASGGAKRAGIVVLALAVLAAITWAVLWFTPVATVDEVRVEGVVNGDAAAMSEATGIATGEKLARVDTDAAARAVAAQPWVEKVTVDRSWPSAITVEVVEHAPVLHIRATDGEHLFNADGVEFLVAPPPPGSVEMVRVPRVENPAPGKLDPDPATVRAVLDVLGALPERVRGEVARVDAPGPTEISLNLHDGREIYFGSSDRASEKGRAAEIVMDREGQRWNVSNPVAPSVRN